LFFIDSRCSRPSKWTPEENTIHLQSVQNHRPLGLRVTPALLKRDRALSPILRVEVENFEIEPEVGALPVIANFVAPEQQRILVKTRSESVHKWRRYNQLNFDALRD